VTPADWFDAFAAVVRFALDVTAIVSAVAVMAGLLYAAGRWLLARVESATPREAVRGEAQARLAQREPIPYYDDREAK
jgi:hypothetical protein